MTARSVVVRLIASTQGYVAAMGAAGAATGALGAKIKAAQAAQAKGMAGLNKGALVAGAALVAMGAYAVKAFAEFDAAMSRVKANSHATSSELEELRASALKAGQTTKFTAKEAADAENELAKAGMSAREIIASLPGVLALAAAGELDLARSAEITSSTLKQFGLNASAAGHVADVLAAAADTSLADVEGLGESMKFAAPAAHLMGVSLEETAGVLALFADNGMKGSIAGTTFADVITRTTGRTLKATKIMSDLGLQFYDANGKFIGLANAAQVLQDRLRGLTDEQRQQVLKKVFGMEGLKGAIALLHAGASGVNAYTDRVEKAGFASRNAAIKMDNLAGDAKKLGAAIQTNFITAGSGANDVLRLMAQQASQTAGQWGALPKPVQQTAAGLGTVAGAGLLAVGVYGSLAPRLKATQEALTKMGGAGAKAAQGIGMVGKTGGVLLAAYAITVLGNAIANAFADAPPKIYDTMDALQALGKTGKITGVGVDVLGKNMSKLDNIKALSSGGFWAKARRGIADLAQQAGVASVSAGLLSDGLLETEQALKQTDGALAEMVTSGHAEDAVSAFDQIAKKAREQGVSTKQLLDLMPNYASAIRNLAEQSGVSADSNAELAAKFGDLQQKIALTTQALKDYHSALSTATQGATADATIIAMQQAFADLRKTIQGTVGAVNKQTDSINLGTAAGQQAATALMGYAQSARNAADAAVQLSQDSDDGKKIIMDARAAFIAQAMAIGLTAEAANDLADKYGLIPPLVETHVVADTDPAKVNLADVKKRMDALNGQIATLKTDVSDAATRRRIAELQAQANQLERTYWINVHYQTSGKLPSGVGAYGNKPRILADGGILKSFASGSERHVAQIAGPGSMRLWAEPETGGEAYIPLAGSKRARSLAIWQQTGNLLGVPSVSGGGGGGGPVRLHPADLKALAAATSAPAVNVDVLINDDAITRANDRGTRQKARVR